jgi:hypothetical protein
LATGRATKTASASSRTHHDNWSAEEAEEQAAFQTLLGLGAGRAG